MLFHLLVIQPEIADFFREARAEFLAAIAVLHHQLFTVCQ